ncbi:hypothetical protein Bca52824_026061 [Brassica carinata]|uniref:SMAX1-like nucleotide binding domain-containing protein n=1 Tax=Brassica carinata TaxID=52824 RepID=A0A8X7SHB8_BRACI|nr:hypothetical protein Bca52824_026061 [Brassica carinata]
MRTNCPRLTLRSEPRVPIRWESDENSRRIGQVLCRKERRNHILVGNCANEALETFADAIKSGKARFLPPEIKGLSVISVEKELGEVGSRTNEEILAKLEELVNDSESGEVMLNLGEVKVFLNGDTSYSGSMRIGTFMFFPSHPQDFKNPAQVNQTLPRCLLCNEKCLQEVAAIAKAGSSVSTADQCFEKLPSWLRAAETELDKGPTTSSAKCRL